MTMTKTNSLQLSQLNSLSASTTKNIILQYLTNNRYTTVNELVTYEPTISSEQFNEALQALNTEGQIRPFLRGSFSAASVWCLRTDEVLDLEAVPVAPPKRKAKKKKATLSLADVPIDPHSFDIINRFAEDRSISTTAAVSYLLGKAVDLLELVQEVQAQSNDNSRGV